MLQEAPQSRFGRLPPCQEKAEAVTADSAGNLFFPSSGWAGGAQGFWTQQLFSGSKDVQRAILAFQFVDRTGAWDTFVRGARSHQGSLCTLRVSL